MVPVTRNTVFPQKNIGDNSQNNESAGKKKTTRVGHAGDYIKPLLVQCALSAIRKKNKPYNADLYTRSNNPPVHRTVAVDEAIFILQRQGFLVFPVTS